jgi:hypothetical protein
MKSITRSAIVALPFEAGEKVEIVIRSVEEPAENPIQPFKGKPLYYPDPFGPAVPEDDWDALS